MKDLDIFSRAARLALCLICVVLAACNLNIPIDKDVPEAQNFEQFTDKRDGNVYKCVKIGDQVWMAENLRYLPQVNKHFDASTTDKRYYVYGYNSANVSGAKGTTWYKQNGVLYNYAASRTAPPSGWRLPTSDDFDKLKNYLETQYGYSYAAAALLGQDWKGNVEETQKPYIGLSGFNASPTGYYTPSGGNIYDTDSRAYYWKDGSNSSYAKLISDLAYYVKLDPYNTEEKSYGYAIRCIRGNNSYSDSYSGSGNDSGSGSGNGSDNGGSGSGSDNGGSGSDSGDSVDPNSPIADVVGTYSMTGTYGTYYIYEKEEEVYWYGIQIKPYEKYGKTGVVVTGMHYGKSEYAAYGVYDKATKTLTLTAGVDGEQFYYESKGLCTARFSPADYAICDECGVWSGSLMPFSTMEKAKFSLTSKGVLTQGPSETSDMKTYTFTFAMYDLSGEYQGETSLMKNVVLTKQ